jgi:putative ABC transport system permease protein
MILLRLISWPYLRKHLLRSILTTVGIAIGVALLVGMHTANDSVQRAFADTVDRISGKAQLQVAAGDAGFPEEVLEKVQALREVGAAAPVIEAEVESGARGQGKLLIVAVDMTGDRSLRDYDFEGGEEDVMDDPLVFIAQPDSIILTRDYAARNGIQSGSKITFETVEGPKQFTVRGLLKAGGMAQAFGGNLAIMDIYAAQHAFGRGRRFDRIDIGVREGVPVAQAQAAIQQAVGPGLRVEPPSSRTRDFENLLGVYTLAMKVSSAFALFIGMFIIYNSFSIAVTQRRSEIGILRALGATRGQIRSLFLGESAVSGLIGSLVGAGIGMAFASSLTAITGTMMSTMFGVRSNAREAMVDPWLLVFAIGLGVATSMVAAFLPARNAARVEPVQALQKGKYQVLSAGENRFRRRAAWVCIAILVLCLFLDRYRPLFYVGYAMTVIATLLLVPFLSQWLVRLLRRPLKWLRPVEGALAADSLLQSPRRTSATVAALVLSLALVVGQGGMARGSMEHVEEWMNDTLNPDVFVSTSENFTARDFRFPASMMQALEATPGVAEVQPVRMIRVRYRNLPLLITSIDMAKVERRVRRRIVAGDAATMSRLSAEGKGVIVAQNLAALTGLKVGDTFELPAPAGTIRVPVVGVIKDLSNQLGTVFIDYDTIYKRYWADDSVDIFRVYANPGITPETLRQSIVEHVGSQRHMFVILNGEVKKFVNQMMDQWFGMTYLQILVAVSVAILGIVNTLTVSITDRRRELGVLRAVGGLRRQIRHTIWMEACTIGVIGCLLGMALGAVNLYYEIHVVQDDLTGIPIGYRFPFAVAFLLLPVILGAAFASAILPAETAVRSSLVEALEYE